MRDSLLRRHRVETPESLLNAIEICDALRVDVADHLRDPQRELLVLLRLTLREQVVDPPQDLRIALPRALQRGLAPIRADRPVRPVT